MKKSLIAKIKKIKLIALDVDGVLTNSQIILNHNGEETKIFNVQDGFGLVIFKKLGYQTAIISARSAGAVTHRANDLKIDKIYQDAYPKVQAYEQLLKDFSVKENEVCFMGDDLPDLSILERVGLAVAVPNALKEVKEAADYITKKHGGEGAVREVVELILKGQGKWNEVIRFFL